MQQSEIQASNAPKDNTPRPDILKKGELIAGRFKVDEKIGQGSFGQIFRGSDARHNRMVAIKVEPGQSEDAVVDSSNDPRRLVIEQKVLLALRKKSNVPCLYASGKTDQKNPYIVMEILGKNLTVLRKERPDSKFTPSTAFRISEQGARALQYLHEVGYIHRDVKPSNCCIGLHPNTSTVYLVDFGMCRKVFDEDGRWHTSLKNSIFKGTIRYSSLNAIKTHDCGPSDDMMGWIYSVIEMALSKLPWAKSKPREMLEMKAQISGAELCKQMPLPFTQCHDYVASLKPSEMPRHTFVNECLRRCIPENVRAEDPYDWETT